MIRFIVSAIATIIVIAVFAFLWLTNPLYAFVGGVVFLVFMLVGFASWLNSAQREVTPEEKKALDPRRTGEYKRPELVTKPEGEWRDNSASGASAAQPQVKDKSDHSTGGMQPGYYNQPTPRQVNRGDISEEPGKSELPAKLEPEPQSSLFPDSAPPPPQSSTQPESKLEPEPIAAPVPESAAPPPPPEPEPAAPAEQEEKSEDNSMPDFDGMSPEEMMEWMESLAKRQGASEGFSTDANIHVAEIDESDERLKGMGEYKPYGMSDEDWQAMQEREATENARRKKTETPVIDEQTLNISSDDEHTDALDITDGDIADLENEVSVPAPELEDLSKQDIDGYLDSLHDKVESQPDVPDLIDLEDFEDEYADYDDIPGWLHNLPSGATEEVDGWLDTDSDATEKGQKTSQYITSEEEIVIETDSDMIIAELGLDDEIEEPDLPDWLIDSGDEAGELIDSDIFGEVDHEREEEAAEEISNWLSVLEKEKELLEQEVAEASGEDSPVQTGSSNFDLMGMIGSLSPDKQQEFYALLSETPIGEQTETQLIRLYEELTSDDDDAPDSGKKVSEAQFTAYYPRQAAAKTEYGFYVYAHEPDALLESDIQQFEQELGGRIPKAKVADKKATIEEGATLAVMIHCDALSFNQVGAMQQWKAPFVRFDFKFAADESLVDEIVEGRIAILMGMIEIASIDFQLAITPANQLALITSIPHDPLTAHNFESSATASLYQRIFISYSRKDTIIAEQYRKIQMMAGNIVFMDTHSIRAGEDWEVALKRFIDEADVFQLFWSPHSATSDHVRFEWEYALMQRCPETRCVQFIRPAYWEKPLPDIPEELNHLHFAFVEIENN